MREPGKKDKEKEMMIRTKAFSGWISSLLAISATMAFFQISLAQVKPRTTDSTQDKTQKTPPLRTPVPPPAATPLAPPPITAPVMNRTNTVDGSTLTKDQFRALPPNAVIRIQGSQITKQEMLDKIKVKGQTMSAVSPTAKLNELRNKFLQKQQTDLKSRNDKVMAALAQRRINEETFTRSAQFLAIHNEALSLQSQYDRATPGEKTRLETRARELQRQLQTLKTTSLH
jgi:hypothetical protein